MCIFFLHSLQQTPLHVHFLTGPPVSGILVLLKVDCLCEQIQVALTTASYDGNAIQGKLASSEGFLSYPICSAGKSLCADSCKCCFCCLSPRAPRTDSSPALPQALSAFPESFGVWTAFFFSVQWNTLLVFLSGLLFPRYTFFKVWIRFLTHLLRFSF